MARRSNQSARVESAAGAEWRKRPTMDDVAKAAGVSKATISRVLSGVPGVCSPATADLVRETAARLGYVVNSVAASLRNRQTFTVGLVIADVSNPFFGGIASGVEASLTGAGYSLILANSGNTVARERDLVRVLVEKQIDGMIVASSASAGDHILAAQERGVAVILVDSEIPSLRADSVVIDNRGAAMMAVQHLVERGHRRIGIVTGPLLAAFDTQRLEGYRAALVAAGLELRDDFVFTEDLLAHGGEKAIEELARLPVRPTALFVANNMMTLGTLVGLKKAGLTVPGDISLIAFDDQEWYSVSQPPITGIVNPAYEMGRTAGDRMLLRLDRRQTDLKVERLVLETHLVERESIRKLRRP
jgi:DNA-binding LacI/PurR family transcriptional regulator